MHLLEKLQILADSAKYDVSCSSSGSSRSNKKGQVGNAAVAGICHSWSDDGLHLTFEGAFRNYCIYDCKYCVNHISNDIEGRVLHRMSFAN